MPPRRVQARPGASCFSSFDQRRAFHAERLRQLLQRAERRILPGALQPRDVLAADPRLVGEGLLGELALLTQSLELHRGSLDRTHRNLSVTVCQALASLATRSQLTTRKSDSRLRMRS